MINVLAGRKLKLQIKETELACQARILEKTKPGAPENSQNLRLLNTPLC